MNLMKMASPAADAAQAAQPPGALIDESEDSVEEEEQAADDSSLTRYLRELRGIALLPPAQEIALAKQREEGESRARDHLLSCPLALQQMLDLGERLSGGELQIDEVIEASAGGAFADATENDDGQRRTRDNFLRRISRLRRKAADLETLERKAARGVVLNRRNWRRKKARSSSCCAACSYAARNWRGSAKS